MSFAKRLLVYSALFFIGLAPQISSQTLRQQAEEDPLSTVIYLLSTTDKDSLEEEKACLTRSLATVDRFAEMRSVTDMVAPKSFVDWNFAAIVNELIKRGHNDEAFKFASILITRFSGEKYLLQALFKPLILLSKDSEALRSLATLDDSDRIDASFELANIYLDLGQTAKASNVISGIVTLVDNSKYGEDKATLAVYLARLGNEPDSLRYINESVKDLTWKSGKPEYTEGRILDQVVEAYRVLGRQKEATGLLLRMGTSEEPETTSLIKDAEESLAKGDREHGKVQLQTALKRLRPNEYWDSFDYGKIVSIYVGLGDLNEAEQIARSFTGSEYRRQSALLQIADEYIKTHKQAKAVDILNFAYERTRKIDTSEAESGQLSTSNKWEQATYQSQIARRFIKMHLDKRALQLILAIKKPYLRSVLLTSYVSANSKRLPAQQLAPHLEKALFLLRQKNTEIFDSDRFDTYGTVARSFAEIGMPAKANSVFAEALSVLSREMIEDGSDTDLLFKMCSIGVEFEASKIRADKQVKASLKEIIKGWEEEAY
jgi:hypothetical protein